MLKGHPKGLIVAFFANMGERFGFYTMMAILVLFLQAKFGLSEAKAGMIYSVFYFSIYGMALVGGFIADRFAGLGKTIFTGLIVMVVGYFIMSVPGSSLIFTLFGLFTIAIGNGLFKGNLQALVGNLYEDPKYEHSRDNAFSIFYMGINIGAFFAPSTAKGIRNWFLESQGFAYDSSLPALCHHYKEGTITDLTTFQNLANTVSKTTVTDLGAFADNYINAFSTGYNYAFGIAALSMIVSVVVYLIFKKHLKSGDFVTQKSNSASAMPWEEEKKRLTILGLVFLVVIFFWMSFHQNGLTLTFFARDYTSKQVSNFSFLFFDLKSFLSIIAAIAGLVFIIGKGFKATAKIIGAVLIVAGSGLAFYFHSQMKDKMNIEPEIFQQFNPIFIVFFTPVVVAFFAWLGTKDKEPSAPKKIGIGMILAAIAFMILLTGSLGLTSPHDLKGSPSPDRVSEYWLISTYLILTFAELFLSPMGISFVSKVAPPRFKGLMQGGWLSATALGNQLLFVGSSMWGKLELWQVWIIFIVCCLTSASIIFIMLKKLESVTVTKKNL